MVYGIAFGGDVGTIFPLKSMHCEPWPEKRGRLATRCRSPLVARMHLTPWHPKYTPDCSIDIR